MSIWFVQIILDKTYYYCKGCLCVYHDNRDSSSTAVLNNSSRLLVDYSETILMKPDATFAANVPCF